MSVIPDPSPISPSAQSLPPFLRAWNFASHEVDSCKNHDHFAIIYDNPTEQLDFIVPFLRRGLERGEKAVFIYDDNSLGTVIAAMERHGIDVDAAKAAGALSIVTKGDAYLKSGDFDPDWMVDFLGEAVESAKKEGFSAVRASGEMTWALGPAGEAHERLIDYECKLNTFFPQYDMGGICQYNRNRFRAKTLMHVIHTHSRLVFRGKVCENPWYIPADILRAQDQESSDSILRLLESMEENTRLRRALAAETEALRRSEKLAAAGRVAAVVAHEINNPLAALVNLHYLLQMEKLPLPVRKIVIDMGKELDRVCNLTQRTLDAFTPHG
ncbi:MAG TPA: MEDS domain-containing protein [Terracidiphilus sp.]|nr:MEDS domain-containing protein [Terracidiphilus sp.]